MAEKWKLGDLEFDTEKEYQEAAQDLKKIKVLMDRFDTTKPDGARKALEQIKGKHVFVSSYGMKFVEKLEKTAGVGSVSQATKKTPAAAGKKQQKKPEKPKKKKEKEKHVHIITKRNLMIGAVVIVVLILVKIFMPNIFSGSGDDNMHRTLVLSYAKNQVELQNDFYKYYKNVLGEDSQKAMADANALLSNSYTMNLADEDVTNMTDKQIEDIYIKLLTGGDIAGDAFNEPQAITDMKRTVADAKTAGTLGDDETDKQDADDEKKVSLVNKMMEYQQRVAAGLTYSYGQFSFPERDVKEYVAEDMEKIFGSVIYDMALQPSEKEMYYGTFRNNGLLTSDDLVRFDTNPVLYNLPDLTPTIELTFGTNEKQTISLSQQSIAPVASVAYELHTDRNKGYLIFRNNGAKTDYVQDDDGNSVVTQGDFLLKWEDTIVIGDWYYNSLKIGLIVNDQKAGNIEYVYDLKY